MALTAKKVYAILNGKIKEVSGDVSKIATPLIFKGSVSTSNLLPPSPEVGWMYNIESKSIYGEAGMNVAWTGTGWDSLGAAIDLSLYYTADYVDEHFTTLEKYNSLSEQVITRLGRFAFSLNEEDGGLDITVYSDAG